MGSHHQITAESAWIYRIFTFGPARVSLTGETIHFEEHLGDALVQDASRRHQLYHGPPVVVLAAG